MQLESATVELDNSLFEGTEMRTLPPILLLFFLWKSSRAEQFRVSCVVTEPLLQPEDDLHILGELCTDILFQKPSGVVEPNGYQSIDPILRLRERNPDIRLHISLKTDEFRGILGPERQDIEKMIDNIISYLKRVNAYGLNLIIGRRWDNTLYAVAKSFLRSHGFSLSISPEEELNSRSSASANVVDSVFITPSPFKDIDNEDWEQKLMYDAANITESMFLYYGVPIEKVSIGLPSTIFLQSNPESPSRNINSWPKSTANAPTRSQLCKDTGLKRWRPKVAIKGQLLWDQVSGAQKWKFAMQFRSSIEYQLWTLQRLGAAGIVVYDLPYTKEKNPICQSQKMLFVKSLRRAIERIRHPRLWRESLPETETSESEVFDSLKNSGNVDESSSASLSAEVQSVEPASQLREEEERSWPTKMSPQPLARSHVFEEDDSKIDRFLDKQLVSMHFAHGTFFYILSKRGEYEEFQDFFQMDDDSLIDGPVIAITLNYDNQSVSVDSPVPDFVTENRHLFNILNKYVAKMLSGNDSVPSLLIFPNVHETFPVPILIQWFELPAKEPAGTGDLDEPNGSGETVTVLAKTLVKREDRIGYGEFEESGALPWSQIVPRLRLSKPYRPSVSYGSFQPFPLYYSLYPHVKRTTKRPYRATTTSSPATKSSTVPATEPTTEATTLAATEEITETTTKEATVGETVLVEITEINDATSSTVGVGNPVTNPTKAVTVGFTLSETTAVPEENEAITPATEAVSEVTSRPETTAAPIENEATNPATEAPGGAISQPETTAVPVVNDPATSDNEPVTIPAAEATSEFDPLIETTPRTEFTDSITDIVVEDEPEGALIETTTAEEFEELQPPTIVGVGNHLRPTMAQSVRPEDLIEERMLPRRTSKPDSEMTNDPTKSEDIPESRLRNSAPTRSDAQIAVPRMI